jgi:hypothetical protein
MKRKTGAAGFLPAILFGVTSAALAASAAEHPGFPAEAFGKVNLSFELNQGQVAPPVEFLARGDGYSILLDSGGMSLRLAGTGRLIKARLVGSNRGAAGEGITPQAGIVSYFLGQDRRQWLNRIPTYARVRYRQVYDGIDLIYYGKQRRLEYDFVVAPGADPEHIQIAYSGVESLRLDQQGNLLFKGPAGDLVQHRPIAYQEIDGSRKAVPAG